MCVTLKYTIHFCKTLEGFHSVFNGHSPFKFDQSASRFFLPHGSLSSLETWPEKAWIASPSDTSPYLQLDLSQVFNVNAVATKGLAGENNPFTKTYSLSYSTSGVNWKNYEENGAVKVSATPTPIFRGILRHTRAREWRERRSTVILDLYRHVAFQGLVSHPSFIK